MLAFTERPELPRGVSFVDGADEAVAIRPLGLMSGAAGEAAGRGGLARRLVGGRIFFSVCEVFVEHAGTVGHCVASLADVEQWSGRESGELARAVSAALGRLTEPRAAFAGLALDRPRIVGVVNVTRTASTTAAGTATPKRPSPTARR